MFDHFCRVHFKFSNWSLFVFGFWAGVSCSRDVRFSVIQPPLDPRPNASLNNVTMHQKRSRSGSWGFPTTRGMVLLGSMLGFPHLSRLSYGPGP